MDWIELGVGEVLRETGKALLCELDDHDVEKWIPKSVFCGDSDIGAWSGEGDSGEIVVKKWWAERHSLL